MQTVVDASSKVDFVIITALEEEQDAVLDKLSGYQKLMPSKDDVRVYYSANLPVTFPDGSTGTYSLIIMSLLGVGRVHATVATSDAIRRWHPQYIILIGIAGGIASKGVNPGDILIADQIVDYELQKLTPDGPQIRWEIHRADPRLVGAARNFRGEEWQVFITTTRPPGGISKRHIGPVASGDKVMAFGEVISKYQDTWPALIGVEMEAAGVATAAFQATQPPGFFMVRGVSDLADEKKSSARVKKWRPYACDTAASYVIAFLQSGPIPVSLDRDVDQYPPFSNKYNTAAIRQLLIEALSDEDLTIWCYDYFREVYQKFALNMSFPRKVQLLIEHCDRNNLFDELLFLLKELNPNKYAQFGPQIDEPSRRPHAHSLSDLNIELPYGTMRSDSKFYIERTADKDCKTYLNKAAAITLFIQAPRQMGKSSLIHRLIDQATSKRYEKKCVFIDFQKFPEEYFKDERKLLIELCLMIGDALGIPEAINQYWLGPRANIRMCSNYLSRYLIPQINGPFILAMDEVERLLTSPFKTNFFGMLRTWHNDRVHDENFAKMTLFLSSSTESYLLIDNPYQSPFNVAERIDLQDFTEEEVNELNRRHSYLLTQKQIRNLMQEIGGHPYLIRRAFYLIAVGKTDLETLLAQMSRDTGPFEDHLHHYLLKVLQDAELKQAMKAISQHHTCAEDSTFHRLRSAGLIKKLDQQVVFRNNLYARYFAEHLNC